MTLHMRHRLWVNISSSVWSARRSVSNWTDSQHNHSLSRRRLCVCLMHRTAETLISLTYIHAYPGLTYLGHCYAGTRVHKAISSSFPRGQRLQRYNADDRYMRCEIPVKSLGKYGMSICTFMVCIGKCRPSAGIMEGLWRRKKGQEK